MFWVRPGLTRIAVRLGPLVFKIPRHKVGIVCNLAEHYISQAHPGERHLVPTLWTLAGWLNVQPYAGRTLREDEVTDAMLEAGEALGILDCGAPNIAADYRGTWAIFDYAFSPETLLAWYARPPGAEMVSAGGVEPPPIQASGEGFNLLAGPAVRRRCHAHHEASLA